MNRSHIMIAAIALGMAALIGISGAALAYPGHYMGGWQGMTQEQQSLAQEAYANHAQQVAPLRQQLIAKRSELDALYYGQNPDSGKVEALYRDIAEIEAKLFTANSELQKSLANKGIPFGGCGMYGGRGMHHGGYGGGYGRGYGGGRGMHRGGHW